MDKTGDFASKYRTVKEKHLPPRKVGPSPAEQTVGFQQTGDITGSTKNWAMPDQYSPCKPM
jgi:hypothetical protein